MSHQTKCHKKEFVIFNEFTTRDMLLICEINFPEKRTNQIPGKHCFIQAALIYSYFLVYNVLKIFPINVL